MALSDKFHLQFCPDHWTPAGKFLHFLGEPFKASRALQTAIQSCVDHTRKFETFAEIATETLPKLEIDKAELKEKGFSPANHARQFAAIIEVMICELYSILDGIKLTTFEIYGGNVRGMQQKSTSKLFSKAAESSYGAGLPKEIERIFTAAYTEWFLELRRLRTAFTHGGLGSCWLDDNTQKISYMNPSLGSDKSAHIIEDIVEHINKLAVAVFELSSSYFHILYAQLNQVESDQFCGIYKGRMYMRKVKPEPNLSWTSGRCTSRSWFTTEPEFTCPMAEKCSAYDRGA